MNEHIDSLIARRLSGECSVAEDAELEAWIGAAPENRAHFLEMKAAWKAMDEVVGSSGPDTGPIREPAAPSLQPTPQNRKVKPKAPHVTSWIKYATAVAAVLIITFIFLKPETREVIVVATTDNREILLPDHSTIRLRKGSSVRYPEHFSATERLVHLDGEAYFTISKREDHRFVVDAQCISVAVVGTSFNVKSGPHRAEVGVVTGRVQLIAKDYAGKRIRLRAGQGAEFSSGMFEETAMKAYDTAWLRGEFVYTTTPLRQIIRELSADADTPVTIDPSIGAALLDRPLQARFLTADPLQEQLRQLDELSGTQSIRQGAGYHLRLRRP